MKLETNFDGRRIVRVGRPDGGTRVFWRLEAWKTGQSGEEKA
jgi:hypothetical protein